MIQIGLDARMVQHTGIGTYLRGMLSGFSKQTLPYSIKLFGRAAQLSHYPYLCKEFQPPIYGFKEQTGYFTALKDCAVWHAPHYNIPYFKGKTKLVVTVHDLIHWIYRKDFFTPLQALYAGVMFRRVVSRADHIIAVSQSTKQDLVKYFNACPDNITVIHEGVEPKFTAFASFDELNATLEKLKLPPHFFLYVGSLKPHKNVASLIRVFTDLKKAGKIHNDLVIVGKKDKKYSESQAVVRDLKTGGGIHFLCAVDNQDLSRLYQGATALIHPSLYEGFGLTLLEAMASGTPVVSSNTSSLPEVGGDAALYFDPTNDRALAEALTHIERSETLRRDLREKGYRQQKKFSWDQAAKQTLQVYDKVLK